MVVEPIMDRWQLIQLLHGLKQDPQQRENRYSWVQTNSKGIMEKKIKKVKKHLNKDIKEYKEMIQEDKDLKKSISKKGKK